MAVVKDLMQVNAEFQEQKERGDADNFKMITFSLAGKDYGVDIMNVKEIAKADKFTYVPNAASFVRGVYNLRGDIIPIIDLRAFFHLPQDRKADGQENMLILRIEDRVYGTIVDKIDKVVGINSETIQPPHPIFGDINIKFISGVVEKQGDLYIILDVIRIFSPKKEEEKPRAPIAEVPGVGAYSPPASVEAAKPRLPDVSDTALGFVKESLEALRHFQSSIVNENWLHRRFSEWASSHSDADIQLRNASDADSFLASFASPCTGVFWDDEYAGMVRNILPDFPSANIQVWNLGCGKGYETFSFACILKERYPQGNIKIWANDSDIMAISQAPNMTFDLEEVPEYCRAFMVSGKNGYSFNQAIKDSVIFEYHDVLNEHQLPQLDIILARDIISFFSAQNQEKLLAIFVEKLKNQGLV
ncbi:MAG: chemotaxis protein CheW, partial [Treponema sp.]|nr:chemotaxis protein CheW [Treponema sp.]